MKNIFAEIVTATSLNCYVCVVRVEVEFAISSWKCLVMVD